MVSWQSKGSHLWIDGPRQELEALMLVEELVFALITSTDNA